MSVIEGVMRWLM